jgi:NAD(P)-dependent dehydrogenase (short-subunit alcohol dehydrogenase family)
MDYMLSKKQNELVRRYSMADDSGKIGIVTGSNSGIGFEAAKMLASGGMRIIMACRNEVKAKAACNEILDSYPEALVEYMHLDLSSQSSVKGFSSRFIERYKRLDLLVNNGGVMMGSHSLTEDGFEKLFGTNHLGHFTLTAMLINLLLASPGSRIVTVSSIAHFRGKINFDDINSLSGYSRAAAYRQSKLANLLFAYELDRRLKEKDKETISVAVHPGITSTNIVSLPFPIDKLKEAVLMSTVKGALPTMMGATDTQLKGGEFIGPSGFKQTRGFPSILRSGEHSYNRDLWLRLWELSEELTGIRFNI